MQSWDWVSAIFFKITKDASPKLNLRNRALVILCDHDHKNKKGLQHYSQNVGRYIRLFDFIILWSWTSQIVSFVQTELLCRHELACYMSDIFCIWLRPRTSYRVIRGPHIYISRKSMYFLLCRTQAGPGRTVKQGQEEISRNHVPRLYSGGL